MAVIGVSITTPVEEGYALFIDPGTATLFRITVTNNNAAGPITSTTMTDNMPGFVVSGAGVTAYTCFNGDGTAFTPSGTVSAVLGSSLIELTGGTIPAAKSGGASGKCIIDVEATSFTPGTLDNIIDVGDVHGTDFGGGTTSNPDFVKQTINVNTLHAATLNKSFSSNTVVTNDGSLVMKLVIGNPNNSPLELNDGTEPGANASNNYGLRDVLPPELRVVSPLDSTSICSSGTAAPVVSVTTAGGGNQTLVLTGGTIPAQGTCTVSVHMLALPNGAASKQITNSISGANDFHNRRNLTANDTTANLTIKSVLDVSKLFNPTTIAAGQVGHLTITFKNLSPNAPLTLSSMDDDPLDGVGNNFTVQTNSAGGAEVVHTNCPAASVTGMNNDHGIRFTGTGATVLAAGASCTITVPFKGQVSVTGEPQAYTDTIPEKAVTAIPADTVSPEAKHNVTVVDQLLVSKAASPSTVAPGGVVKYDITISNYSVGQLTNVRIPDVLPTGMSLVSLPAAPALSQNSSCSSLTVTGANPSTSPIFNIGTVPSGTGVSPSVCTVTFYAMAPLGAPPAQPVQNTIAAGAITSTLSGGGVGPSNHYGSNQGTNNDPDSGKTTISANATISNVFSPTTTTEGSVALLTITLTNLSGSDLTDASFTDALPTGTGGAGALLQIANPSNVTSTCGGTLVAVPGSSVVSFSGGKVPARQSGGFGAFGTCVVQVKVTGAAGTYNDDLPPSALSATETKADGTTRTVVSPAGVVAASITFNPALTASKSFSPTEIAAGGKATVKFNLANSSVDFLNGVALHDNLPTNMVFATPLNARSTCAGTANFTAVPPAGGAPAKFDASGMSIAPKSACDVLFDVVGNGASNWDNIIPVGGVTAPGGVKNLQSFHALLTNKTNGAVGIAVSVANNGSLLAPGQSALLTIQIHNTGDVDLDNLSLSNYFTEGGLDGAALTGMQIASSPNFATTCTGGLVGAINNGNGLNLHNASLLAHQDCQITANITMVKSGSIVNTIPAGAVIDSQGITNPTIQNTSIQAQGNTGVTKSFTPPVIKLGERSRLRLTFINPNTIPLLAMSVVDHLPLHVTVAPGGGNPSTTCTGATISGSASTSVSVSGGSLLGSTGGTPTTCIAEIDVVADAVGSYTNTIPAGDLHATVGGTPAPNSSPTSAILQVLNPIGITKSFDHPSVQPGEPSHLSIVLNNTNGTAMTGAALTDVLPSNVVVAQAPTTSISAGCGGTLSAPVSATSVTWTGGTIPANGNCTLKVDVVSNIAGKYTNVIPAGALITQEGATNDTPATADLSLLDPPTVNKQFSPVSIPAGGFSALTIVLGNTNATAAATLTDDLVDTLPISPGPIVVATPNGLSNNTCPGTPTAAAGSGKVTYPSGAKIPAGGCSFTINVTGLVQGTYNNFIAVDNLKTDIGNNPVPASANLVITPLGAISGRVFKENSVTQDGIFNNGTGTADVGIGNVTITLTGTNFGADGVEGTPGDNIAVSLTTSTDALGNYAFPGLLAGRYLVTEPTQPAGTLNGIVTPGTVTLGGTQGSTVAGDPVSKIKDILLAGVGTVSSSPNNNFAEIVPSSLSGSVYLDQNSNGTKDLTDLPLTNVTVELVPTGSTTALFTKHTDATGAYSFTDVPPGNYFIRETQPPNTINGVTVPGTTANGGNAGTGSPATTPTSTISGIVLPPNTNSVNNNFAELASGRQVNGTVYMDANDNGAIDAGEVGIAGVTLVLTGHDINNVPVPPNTTTVTDANGRYIFMGLPEGTYIVTEPTQPPRSLSGKTTGSPGSVATLPTVVPSVISTIDLTTVHTVSTDNNFGEIPIPTGTVSGKVYIDTNDNGIIDSGEQGVNSTPGVELTLSGTEADNTTPFTVTVHTDATGAYIFPNVPPSNAAGYTITEIQPALFKDGKTTVAAGNPGTPASGKPVLSNNIDIIRGVVVIAGDVLPNYNFGEIPVLGAGLIPPIVNGYVYLDKDHDHTRDNDGTSIGQPNWTVNLTENGKQICTVNTDAVGFYQFDNLHCPGYEGGLPAGSGYKITFTKDNNSLPAVPTSGGGRGQIAPGGGVIENITLGAADQVIEQDLPLDPSGVIYDSSSRTPVAGAVISISGPPGFDPASQLVGGAAAQTQTVGTDGFYQFLLQNSFPAGVYTLSVTPPGGYAPAPSTVLGPCTNAPLSVGGIPNPAMVQASNTAPGQSVPQPANTAACQGLVSGGSNSTQYYFSFVISSTSAAILNNHIPLDPANSSEILVTKTSPLVNVSRGDLVPYTITATNTVNRPLNSVAVRDQIPPGFKYRIGSASLNGVNMEPTVNGRVLTWPAQNFATKEKKTYRLILQVGSGVGDGKYVNQGFAISFPSGFMLSNLATATVNVVPDPTFDCPDVIGKVFDDQNANGYQDQDEPGIPAVRIATARGLLVMTDAEGRFHVPCPEIPNEDRGSNFVMKLDTRTLPSGYRITTENPRDIRLTRGKVSKLNFGATIHRVVRLELSDSAFVPNSDALQPEWQKQLDALPETLKQRPSVVRLSYTPGGDGKDLVQKRITAITKQIKGRWTALKGQYTLDIETEDAQ